MSRQILLALLAGVLFGAGLAISGMADPARVRGFLDLAGTWDPTLAFVMGGALIPMALAWGIRSKLEHPLAAPAFDLPETRRIDARLIAGAAVFGIGWGVAGLCPGPAFAGLAVNAAAAGTFVVAMLAGMALHRLTLAR
ncbi:MAG: YeeE/YedE family protein [Alphaproteobacteria bacterium]|nr:YeeE/YedE family protein [Alphaproteobacteria bacterium]